MQRMIVSLKSQLYRESIDVDMNLVARRVSKCKELQ
jgi:hypothetical protein